MSTKRPPRPQARRARPAAAGDRVEAVVEVTAIAAGGDGVARLADGRVAFVARAAVGDHVRIAVREARASFVRADIVEVLAPGPGRRTPRCPQFAAQGCGGCAWQHLTLPAQHAAKLATVQSALRRAVERGLQIAPLATPVPETGWRRRARLHVDLRDGRIGFFAEGSHRVVDATGCEQLDPRLLAPLELLRRGADMGRIPGGELHIAVGHDGVVGMGATMIELEPGLATRADGFAQASTAGNAAIIAAVREAAGPGPGACIELFAGAGNLTRGLVADGWTVSASDVVAPAGPTVAHRFDTGDAAVVYARLVAAHGTPALVVLDPPRTGTKEAAAALAAAPPSRAVYVSCDLATLARDLDILAAGDLKALRAWPIDTMPMTPHLEIVVLLERPPASVRTNLRRPES